MTLSSDFTLSCEFFPPRNEAGEAKFRQVAAALSVLKPAFFSVTFGAGGSTQDKTLETVLNIQNDTEVQAAPHLSCVARSKADIHALLSTYREHGIRRIVALRGDRPSGLGRGGLGEMEYARDLVRYIREEFGDHFFLEVAAYPEFHPEASSASADLRHFKEKVEAGADSAITQYFYNPDAYFRFLDDCQKLGVDIPIIPGIMPITSSTQLFRFSDACGAEIPRWLRWRLSDFGDDKASLQAFGIDMVTALCQRLIDGGAPGLHFYTLNRQEASLNIAERLGLTG